MTIEEMKQIKENRGYSLKTLSEYSGVPTVTLQKIFSGATTHPRKATLDAIERVLTGQESVYQGKAYDYLSSGQSYSDISASEQISKPPFPYAVSEKKQGEYTLDDYYALPEDLRVELIDGVFFEMNSPRTVHQDIVSIVHFAFYQYIKSKKKPCKVFSAPTDVQICCDNRTMVQPDVLVICDRDKIRSFGIYGAPDFILEVLSKSTRKKDMTIKLGKYVEAGVREYWIIDPNKKTLIVYNLSDEDYIPAVYPIQGKVPVMISGGELEIDLDEIASSIDELGSLE